MPSDFADIYLFIMFANFLYMIGLLYGGMWYTKRTTVKCPQCGIRFPKYRVENHQCHPALLSEES